MEGQGREGEEKREGEEQREKGRERQGGSDLGCLSKISLSLSLRLVVLGVPREGEKKNVEKKEKSSS